LLVTYGQPPSSKLKNAARPLSCRERFGHVRRDVRVVADAGPQAQIVHEAVEALADAQDAGRALARRRRADVHVLPAGDELAVDVEAQGLARPVVAGRQMRHRRRVVDGRDRQRIRAAHGDRQTDAGRLPVNEARRGKGLPDARPQFVAVHHGAVAHGFHAAP
jgi:hypothetical protein